MGLTEPDQASARAQLRSNNIESTGDVCVLEEVTRDPELDQGAQDLQE